MLRLYCTTCHRRCLRYKVRVINLPQVFLSCGRLGVQVRDGCGPTLGAVNPFVHPHNIEEKHLFNNLGISWWG